MFFIPACFVLLALVILLYFITIPKRYRNSPPIIGRFIPFIGVAKQFGTEPITLLEESKKKYGDVFTLNVAGKCFTFFTDKELFNIFFNPAKANACKVGKNNNNSDKAVSFDHAVIEFTSRVFGIEEEDFFKQHIKMVNLMRSRLSPSTTLPGYTKEIASNLMNVFEKTEKDTHIKGSVWKENGCEDLFQNIIETLFWSTVKSLYEKEAFLSNDKDSCQAFQTLDKNFEIRASGIVPEFLLKSFCEAKNFLISMIKQSAKRLDNDNNNGTNNNVEFSDKDRIFTVIREALMDEVSVNSTLGFCLSVLWASQANSLPSTLWTICYVISNKDIYEKLQKEIDQVFSEQINDPRELTYEKLNLFPYLTACVYEGVRIIPPGMMIRKIMHPIKLPNYDYVIPKGHNICLSPYVTHRDERWFKDATKFMPERWIEGNENFVSDKSIHFISWGKSVHICPGKDFSVCEMVIFLALFFHKFRNIRLNDETPFPEPNTQRLIGTPHPKTRVSISYEKQM
ncbi:hypothetical protein ABK040_004467 [Willaertia magna]